MALAAGSRLGPYEVQAAIGAGGMGEVYRARDLNLGRDVALKAVLPEVAADPDRLARFSREARVLASLNHPSIAQIHGVEEAGGQRVLVMELVEGPTLADRIARGRLPIDEALPIARQIADALEAAHEQGIVHRDLKPANIKVRDDGTVKVLDFGLAKALVPEGASATADAMISPTVLSPTMTTPAQMTAIGMIIGTAAYMAPEQARGKAVDKRADIWAFGAVLFEMLAGRPCFNGDTVTDVLAAVVKSEPDWAALPADTPPRVRRLLARCLAKDRRERLHDIADARIELSDEETAAVISAVAPRRGRALLPWAIAVVAVGASVGWALFGARPGGITPRALTLAALAPAGTVSAGPIDLSPDGRQLAFTAAGPDGETRLYLRSLDALEPRALPGTEDASAPFFSPDGRSIGFFAGRKLKRIDLAGGPPRELADAPDPRGGSWGSQNEIVFAPDGGGPIFRVSASGGSAAPVTTLDATSQEVSHRWPHFLPDGTRFLFLSRKPRPPGRLAIEAASIDGGRRARIIEAGSGGIFCAGRLYFVRDTTLLAQAFDPATFALSGEPEPVAEDVWRNLDQDGLTAFGVAADGTVAWRRGGLMKSQLTWLDRQGRPTGTVGQPGIIGSVNLSPDGRRVLAAMSDPTRDTTALFLLDNSPAGIPTRVSFGDGNQFSGIFSPDGRSMVFAWDVNGAFDLYERELGTAGDPLPLVVNGAWKFAESWSPDGRFLSYSQTQPGKPPDIWILPISGDRKPFRFAGDPGVELGSAFSPDGRFLAYASDESGPMEAFVQTFPATGAKWQVSTGGGGPPVWRSDGMELFYVTPDRRLVSVSMAVSARGLKPGPARTLFQNANLREPSISVTTTFRVSADGQRFLILAGTGEAESAPILIRTERPR